MQRIGKIATGLLGGIFTLLLIGQAIAGITPPPPSCVEPPDNLVSWYPGDGNAFDIQGANDGTLQNGATFAAGKVEQAFSLDGVDDFVTVPDSASLDVTQITVDAWIYLTGVGDITDHQGIYAKSDNTGDSYSLFIRDSTLGLYNSLTFNGVGQVFETGGGVIQPGVWQHVAQTYDGTTLKNYVNGQLVQSWAVSGSITPNNGPLTISSRNGQHPFQGLIDEVEVFNRALSQSEIQAIVDAGSAGKCRPCTPPPSEMVSWYPGDGNAFDIQGANDGTLQNGATFAAGKVDQAFSLDGVDDYVSLGNPAGLKLSGSLTLDAWVKPNDFPEDSQLRSIISKFSQSPACPASSAAAYGLYLFKQGGVIKLQAFLLNTSGALPGLGGGTVPPGVFSHVAFTFDNATGIATLYLNGAIVASDNFGTGGICVTDAPVFIGGESANGSEPAIFRFFPGLIDG